MSVTVVNGEFYYVPSGQTDTGDTVDSGGRLTVVSGGTTSGTVVNGGGQDAVYGTAIGTVVNGGGQDAVYGGTTSGTVVNDGGQDTLYSGTAIGTFVNSGGQDAVSGGTAIGTIVDGNQNIYGYSTVSGTVVNNGGDQYVYDYATVTGTVVSNGGNQYVYDYAIVSGTVVHNGGDQYLYDYATAIGTVVNSGGDQYVEDYSTASSTTISDGGRQDVSIGATTIGTAINSGGTEIVSAGGSANDTTVSGGGKFDILNGGTAIAPNLSPGGVILVGGTLVIEDQSITVSSGGIVLQSGGQIDLVSGQVSGTLSVVSGATVNALSGTNVLQATSSNPIANAGVIEVESGATLTLSGTVKNSSTLFASGGTMILAGVVSGGITNIGNGSVDIQQASSEIVAFQLGGSGGLELAVASAYTGKVSGFGSGGDTSQFIDLTNVAFNGNVSSSYSGNTTSGVLKVTSGGHTVASINMVGSYTSGSFHLAAGIGGSVEITDPPVERWAHRASGNWTTVSNWAPSVVPGYNDNVVINLAGPYTVTSLADETVNNLALVAGVSLDIGGGSGFVALNGAANSGTIDVQDNSTFEIGGTLGNAGLILLNSTGDTTEWVIDGNVTLGGKGKVHLANAASAIVSDGSIGTLTNVNNTVSGNGTIGDANLTIINQSLGVIEAGAGQSLAITGAVTNLGNVESYGSLQFNSDDVNNAGGKIRTLAVGASISLDGATIAGGTISTVAGSTITGSGVSELDGTTVSNAGTLATAYGSTFTINSSVINNSILQATNGNLILNGAVTGTGSATIIGTGELKVVSAFAENINFAANSTGTLILDTPAALSGTIHGFGDGTIDLPNVSFGIGTTLGYTPNASNTGGVLHVSDGTHSANIGLFGHFQAAGFQDGDDGAGGTLIGYVAPIFWKSGVSGNFATASNWDPADVPGSGNAAIIAAAGTYTVASSLSETVYSLATAIGATLEIAADTFTVTNQAGALTNAGTIAVDSTGILAIDQGLIKNTGTIAISGDLNFGDFFLPPTNVTLRGGGSVVLSGNSASLNSFNLTTTLTNADNTISGVGNVSLSNTLINQSSGIIDAGGSGLQDGNNNLQIDSANLNNLGTIENTGYGFLLVFGNQGNNNTITNSGVIEGNDWSISGNLNNSNMIEATGSNATDSIIGPVDNTGNIEVLGTTNGLSINGAITDTGNETINNGTLTLVAAVSAGQQLTFSGSSGALVLDDAPDFAGTVAGFALDNSIDLTTIKFYSSSFHLTYTPNQNNTGGVLSVTDGTNSAAINIVGSYTQANFIAKTDGNVGTLITDPPVMEQQPGSAGATIANDTVVEVNVADSGNVTFAGATGTLWLDQAATFSGTVAGFGAQDRIDLSSIGFGAHTTLGYSENESDTGGTLTVTDGTHTAAIALLGNYMASTLVSAADGHGGTLVTEAPIPGQPPPLAHPHA